MTVLEQVRAIALLLPEAEERVTGDMVEFLVDGVRFASVADDAVVRVREAAGETAITIDDGTDWALVEDRIARSWELSAPRRLLEAGGR